MAEVHQYLLAPICYPIEAASEGEKQVFADRPNALKTNHFYRFNLSTGQSFIGCIDAEKREAFFRLANNQWLFPGLREIHYYSKYICNKPVLLSELVLSPGCSKEEKVVYQHAFDTHTTLNFDGNGDVTTNNHALGEVTEKMIPPLRELEYAEKVKLKSLKEVKNILNGSVSQMRKKEQINDG